MPAAVHLDAAAGVPLHPAARAALLAALDDGWADPTRLYGSARRARLLLDGAREAVAALLGARPDEVRFTASGTAAVREGIAGALAGRRRTGSHVVHSAIEHSAVLHAVAEATSVPVDRHGRVDVAAYAAALRADADRTPALACLISASHEVGTIQPVEDVAALCAERGVPLLVDAGQTLGRAPLPSGWSLLTASAHKWGGPPGVGVLVVRTGTRFEATPAGAPDLPAIVAAAVGLEAAVAESAAEDARLRPLVDRIRSRVAETVPDVEIVGDPVDRLPHLVTFSCLYVDGEALLTALDREGFAVSSGSSCTADTIEPSHVLAAMGVLTHGNVRVSLHRGTTEGDVDRFLEALPRVVAELRRDAGVQDL
ncbi:MAG: cysteine desulfurase [Actinomycetota bacterium]|jgi:cysteine desulfurase|nr:cysteine desulfurase [Actinomycetota bacterium]